MPVQAKARSETICLKGYPERKEAQCLTSVSPGNVIIQNAAGQVIKNTTAGANISCRVVHENELLGGIRVVAGVVVGDGTIASPYAALDRVYYGVYQSGQECQLRLPANAAAIVVGDKLECDATGCVRKLTTGTPLFEALEAVNNSANGTEVFINAMAI